MTPALSGAGVTYIRISPERFGKRASPGKGGAFLLFSEKGTQEPQWEPRGRGRANWLINPPFLRFFAPFCGGKSSGIFNTVALVALSLSVSIRVHPWLNFFPGIM